MYGKFQSTHPLRGATSPAAVACAIHRISIHAPLAGCDHQPQHHGAYARYFNPRTPCGVRRGRGGFHFQQADFNPRTPCGVRQTRRPWPIRCRHFNPRTPCGVRPAAISSDVYSPADFNPRTPCGVRPPIYSYTSRMLAFQSTHPLRGATKGLFLCENTGDISIHAPLAGCDARPVPVLRRTGGFQSTHPLRGATLRQSARSPTSANFNPRTPCGVRQQKRTKKTALFLN